MSEWMGRKTLWHRYILSLSPALPSTFSHFCPHISLCLSIIHIWFFIHPSISLFLSEIWMPNILLPQIQMDAQVTHVHLKSSVWMLLLLAWVSLATPWSSHEEGTAESHCIHYPSYLQPSTKCLHVTMWYSQNSMPSYSIKCYYFLVN